MLINFYNSYLLLLGNVLSIRIYDANEQVGKNPCSDNKGSCSHLCLPISQTEKVCKCATGYTVDANDPTRCIGKYYILLFMDEQ